jgi:hypothetical protein
LQDLKCLAKLLFLNSPEHFSQVDFMLHPIDNSIYRDDKRITLLFY